MSIETIYSDVRIGQLAQARFAEERGVKRLDGWFRIKEIRRECDCDADARIASQPPVLRAALTLREINAAAARDQRLRNLRRDAGRRRFARSYALINPGFAVESFTGYCDPTAVFGDIEANDEFSAQRIASLRAYREDAAVHQALGNAYAMAGSATCERRCFSSSR